MNRRTILVALGALMSGCATQADCSENRPPSIEGDEPTLAPGEETDITVSATGVSGLSFVDPYPNDAYFMMNFRNESVSPDTAYGSDGSPPGYGWDGCTDVEVRIPLTVPPDVELGEYYYLVHASAPGNEDPPSSKREFTIAVSNK